jgi:hypothetical protein
MCRMDAADAKLGVSRSLLTADWEWPVHGLRHMPAAETSGGECVAAAVDVHRLARGPGLVALRWAAGQGVMQQCPRGPFHDLDGLVVREAGDVGEPDQ